MPQIAGRSQPYLRESLHRIAPAGSLSVRHFMIVRLLVFVLAWTLFAPLVNAAPYKVLVFSKTAGFRHASIPDGLQAIRRLGTNNSFTVDASENSAVFTSSNLQQYRWK